MAAIDTIVQVNVTTASTAVAAQSFAVPLILGPTKATGSTPTVITCAAASDLLTNGYTASSPEYLYAVALCSQAVRPPLFKVATRTASGTLDADIAAVTAVDDTWYGLCTPLASDADIALAATAIEGMTKIYIAASATPAIGQSGTADLASQLQSKSLTRTALLFSPGSAALGIDAAWLGGQLPKAPGSSTWAFKTLAGITADTLTATQVSTVIGVPTSGTYGKGGNVYQQVGGVGITQMGTMAGGSFIDMRIGTDSLRSAIKTGVFSVIASNEKIPYTNAGCTIIESAIRAAIAQHQTYGFISSQAAVNVDHTPVLSVPQSQRQARVAPPFTFSCTAAGAQHAATINGTVTV